MNALTKTSNKNLAGRLAGAILLSLLMLVSFTGSAMAQGNPQDVSFSDLHVAKQGRKFVLEYSISKQDWRELQRTGIQPRLNIYTPDDRRRRYQFRYSVPIDRRRGAIEYDRDILQLRGAKTVEIELVGYNQTSRIRKINYNRTTDKRLRLAVERGNNGGGHGHGHGHGHHNGVRAQVIEACKAQTKYDSEFNSCLKRGLKLDPHFASATVNACGKATRYSSELNLCLDKAAGLHDSPDAVVKACDDATKYSSELVGCIQRSKKLAVDPARTIAACDAQTRYGSELNSCIDKASAYTRRSPAPVITACGVHTKYASDLNRCIQKAQPIRGNRAAIVNACGESTRYASEMFSCMNTTSAAAPSHRHRSSNGRVASR